jgi:hypothetical protein
MARHSRSLVALCQCLGGKKPRDPDWLSLLGLANETLTTPFLIDLVDQSNPSVPEDVRAFVQEVYRRNTLRNQRLCSQLEEAVSALNERDVIPVLLKGAANLVTAAPERRPTRVMADLDIVVEPDQMELALQTLAGLGYQLHFQAPADSKKQYADLKRAQDVGMIDLHQTAPGPAYFYRVSGKLLDHCRIAPVGRGAAYIPTPTYQAYMLMIHDQFQDYGYWIGEIDVRHLIELRDLARSSEGIDWDRMISFAPNELVRNAIESQLVALAELFDVDIPADLRGRFIPRLQFKRLLLQARFPLARWPLLAVCLLDYGKYRRGPGAEDQTPGRSARTFSLPKSDTLRFILGIVADHRTGKV